MRGDSDQEKERGSERMSTTANLAARLGEAIGAKRVIDAAEELAAYAVDGLVPEAIVRPTSMEEAAETVRFAVAEKLGVVPLGSRSKCEMGMAPSRYNIALDMTGLREIAHYDAGDLTLSVDAGLPLRELELFLKRHGQFLPLAVPCFESTTAGGAIASGIDSSLRMQYGAARDFLIGAEFVDGTGQGCKSGGRVVKNVTGYDLHKMLVGSLGTLGVITRLNFRTFPLPAEYGGHVATFADLADALGYRNNVEKLGLPLANLEMVSPEVARMICAILRKDDVGAPEVLEREGWHVYSAYEGNEAVVRRISTDLERIAGEAGAQHEILQREADEMVGGMLRESYEWLRWGAPAVVLHRVILPEMRAETLQELTGLAAPFSMRSTLLVRASGIIYFGVFAEDESEAASTLFKKVAAAVRALAQDKGGHASLLHAPTEIKAKLAKDDGTGTEFELHRRVKLAFDPFGVFAPGRIVGGV
jgi:glycolate dehydrogenase FAD-binding subunit